MDIDQIRIDKISSLPISEQLAGEILKLIRSGSLLPGERLSPERNLAEALGISRGTVKRSYSALAREKIVEIRPGSGSYVLVNGSVLDDNHKRDAAEKIASVLSELRASGLSDKEIYNLIGLHLTNRESIRKVKVMVLSNNHEILAELEKQLSYLIGTTLFSFTLSFMTLDHIQRSGNPLDTLFNYDLIIATSIDYPAILSLAPMYTHKIIEAAISPRTNTLIELSGLTRDARISIVYRTPAFLNMVTKALLSLGFKKENFTLWTDAEYLPEVHRGNSDHAVVTFNESPVFIDSAFEPLNRAFNERGGRMIYFEYRIDRGSLTYIEDRIHDLLTSD